MKTSDEISHCCVSACESLTGMMHKRSYRHLIGGCGPFGESYSAASRFIRRGRARAQWTKGSIARHRVHYCTELCTEHAMLGHHLAYVGNENDTAFTERSRVLQTQRRFKQTTSLQNRLSDFFNGERASFRPLSAVPGVVAWVKHALPLSVTIQLKKSDQSV